MLWSMLVAFIGNAFRENKPESFGRLMALPFLIGSCGIAIADGIVALVHRQSALDAAASLALTGIALFTGSKMLSVRGQKMSGALGGAEPPALPPPPTPPVPKPAVGDDAG